MGHPHLRTSWWIHWVALAVAVVVMLLRHPTLLTDPVFYAEEGTVYFENAWVRSPAWALVAPYGGYYVLVPNVATLWAAYCVPIEYAPWITMPCALLVAQLPVIHILWSPARFFSASMMRYGSALAVVLLSGFFVSTTTPAEFGLSQTSSFSSMLWGTLPKVVPSSRMYAHLRSLSHGT